MAARPVSTPADLNAFGANRFPGLVGLEIVDTGPGELVGRIPVTEPLIAGTGYVWAPVVVGLADILCAYGTPAHMTEGAESFTTVELKTNFLGSARVGDVLEGRARPAHVGRTTQVWDAEVRNTTTDRVVALFRCTQMVLYPR